MGWYEYSIFLEHKHMLQFIWISLSFLRFCLQDVNTDFMFEIFHPQSNTGLKASLALMYVAALILQSSNLEC